ncbi:hypothetical protein HV417_02210 [Bacillus sporothermodurans]|uniref:hypothetical protein n=1 Tax=Heyndrickxia sporothermodurans TaxID=46224 RepID=UPI00192B6C4A|nr:hypothetical protein [Heyndrickxia sporothermodurans]MBL5833281.1 hypothetical protein [Heyndrickxia sporothermodurans]MBL5872377.1 hypothetical protein [Heyndrickxia sporothermodurans]
MEKDKYLMKQCFDNFNAFKRYQTKEEIEREKGSVEQARYFELQKYKTQAKLELSLRALQRELYKEEEESSTEE